MNKTIEEQLALLKETKDFYSEGVNKRALVPAEDDKSNFCVYINTEGNNCGVGRCMTNEALEDVGDILASIEGLVDDLANNLKEADPEAKIKYKEIDDLLKEEYKGFSNKFWRNIQAFHDDDRNWDNEGLSDEGLSAYNNIKNYIKSGELSDL